MARWSMMVDAGGRLWWWMGLMAGTVWWPTSAAYCSEDSIVIARHGPRKQAASRWCPLGPGEPGRHCSTINSR